MKFRFIINAYPQIQSCCDFLTKQWRLSNEISFYLQLYIEEYFTNLFKYTFYKRNTMGLQASYKEPHLNLLFWDKTDSFNPKEGVGNGLGTRLLTQLFPYKYRSLNGANFFYVKILI